MAPRLRWLSLVVAALAAVLLLWCSRSSAPAAAPAALRPAPADGPGASSPPPSVAEREPLAVGTEPAPPAAPEAGADEYWWDGLRQPSEAGAIDVLVLRGRAPVAGARVRRFPAAVAARGSWDDATATVEEQRTDAQGRARFAGVDDGDWVLRADAGGEHVVRTLVAPGRATVLLLFGTARIDGRVGDAAGVPLPGLQVCISGIGPQPSRVAFATTDRDGAFAATGLAEGRYHVQVRGASPALEEHMVELAAGEAAQVCFGRALPLARWRGRLVDAAGAPVFGVRALFVQHEEQRDERGLVVDADGSFAIDLQPGSWRVFARRGLHHGELLDAVAVPAGGARADVRWPCLRIVGELLAEDPQRFDARTAAASLQLEAQARAGVPAAPTEGPFGVGTATVVQWLLPAPGRYRIRSGRSTAITQTADGTLPVEVTSALPTARVLLYLRQAR